LPPKSIDQQSENSNKQEFEMKNLREKWRENECWWIYGCKSQWYPSVVKANGVLGNEKWDSTKITFKTGANSASPNANQLHKSTTPREEPLMVTMRLGLRRDDKPGKVT